MTTITKHLRMAQDGQVERVTWTNDSKGAKVATVATVTPTGDELRRLRESPYGETRVLPVFTYTGPDNVRQDIYQGEPVHGRDMDFRGAIWICPIDGRWNGMWYLVPETMLCDRP
jgi:hypothetical protein